VYNNTIDYHTCDIDCTAYTGRRLEDVQPDSEFFFVGAMEHFLNSCSRDEVTADGRELLKELLAHFSNDQPLTDELKGKTLRLLGKI
jgi:hypothetical protein